MSILAKRFEFLDKETNLGINDFINVEDSNIRNIEIPDTKITTDTLSDFLFPVIDMSPIKKDAAAAANTLPAIDLKDIKANDFFRTTKELTGEITSISKMPNKLADSLLSDLFPDGGIAKKLAKDVFKNCNDAGNGFGNMRPFDLSSDCGGNNLIGSKGNCKPSGMSDLLDALTGGKYGKHFKNINGLINAVMGLAKGSYGANICGGFKASSSLLGTNKAAIDRAGLLTIASLVSTHQTKGMLDVLNTADPNKMSIQNPNMIKGLIGSPTIAASQYGGNGSSVFMNQFGVDSRNLDDIYNGITDGATLLNENWDKNSSGDLSLAKFTNSTLNKTTGNTGFNSLVTDNLKRNTVSSASLNSVNDNPMDTIGIAYASLF
jgi:hypothetical protein